MEMTPERWRTTAAYMSGVFGREDEQLATLMRRATASGLPDIAVSADVGRLLELLVSLARARTVVEVGTLAGYSTIWLARGLAEGGRVVTIELEDAHADFAQGEFEAAGLAGRIELRRGAALEVLPRLARELGEDSLDVLFLDAVKTEYGAYLDAMRPCLRRGGLVLADNALGSGSWWITDPAGEANRDAMDRFNRALAEDGGFRTACVANREGLLVAQRL